MASKEYENWKSKVKTVALFLFLAIPGLFVFLASSMILIVQLFGVDKNLPHPLKATAFCIAGMFLMLIGVGKWKQWGYLIVFISIPFAIAGVLALISVMEIKGKDGVILLPLFALPILFLISRIISERYKSSQQSEKLKE